MYRITKTITADGVPLRAGDVVAADEIERGCLESMVRTGVAVPLTAAEAEAARVTAGEIAQRLAAGESVGLPDGFVLAPAAEFQEAAARLKEWEAALAARESAAAERARALDEREAAHKARSESPEPPPAEVPPVAADPTPPAAAAGALDQLVAELEADAVADLPLSGGAIPPAVAGPAHPPALQAKPGKSHKK